MTGNNKKLISLNRVFRYFLLILALIFFGLILQQNEEEKKVESNKAPVISILPETIMPGDPIMITVNASSTPVSISYDEGEQVIVKYNFKISKRK